MNNKARLDSFLQQRITSVKHVKTEVDWERKPDGTVRMHMSQESTEITAQTLSSEESHGLHTVVLRLADRNGAAGIAGLLSSDRLEDQPLFFLPEAPGYEELKSLGMLVVQIPWWDVAIKRLQEIPGIEMIHDAEVQWRLPDPVEDDESGEVSALAHETIPKIIATDELLLKSIRSDLGQSVKVAVLDTGIDPDHPLFSHVNWNREDRCRNFTASGSWHDQQGHGTHIASILCGQNPRGKDEVFSGVAPGTQLYIGKVLDDTGSGSSIDIVKAMRWAAAEVKADIVSMSLGGGSCAGDCLLCSALDILTEEYGTLFVVSAGNDGPHKASLTCPANSCKAIVVAAGTRNNQVSDFSSRGPSENPARKGPDLVAPGCQILAAKAGARKQDPVTNWLARRSGTSMAAPHVAGYLAAIFDYSRRLLDAEPELLKADPVKFLSVGTQPVAPASTVEDSESPSSGPSGSECQGIGRLDATGFRSIVGQLGFPAVSTFEKVSSIPTVFSKKPVPRLWVAAAAALLLFVGIGSFIKWGSSSPEAAVSAAPAMLAESLPPQLNPQPSAPPIDPTPQLQSYPYFKLLQAEAKKHNLPEDLALAIVAHGSDFNALYQDLQQQRFGLMALPWPLPLPGHGLTNRQQLYLPSIAVPVGLAYYHHLLDSVAGQELLAWQLYRAENGQKTVTLSAEARAGLSDVRQGVCSKPYSGDQQEIVQLFESREKAQNYLVQLAEGTEHRFEIAAVDQGFYAVVRLDGARL